MHEQLCFPIFKRFSLFSRYLTNDLNILLQEFARDHLLDNYHLFLIRIFYIPERFLLEERSFLLYLEEKYYQFFYQNLMLLQFKDEEYFLFDLKLKSCLFQKKELKKIFDSYLHLTIYLKFFLKLVFKNLLYLLHS